MIVTDFAPNDTFRDALESLITLSAPWRWQTGTATGEVKQILSRFFPDTKSTLFLSGRGALSAAIRAAALPRGAEVIVQGFTCEAVVLPILHHGLTPVYADIERETYSFDLQSLKEQITSKTVAIILQHTFGIVPAHRAGVLQLAKEKNLLIIEDLAHGFEPAFWQKQRISDKHLILLSFGRSKALSSVFGGALLTSDKAIEARLHSYTASLPYPSRTFIAKLLCYKPVAWLSKKTYNFAGFGKLIHFLAKKTGLLIAEISRKEKGGSYDAYLEKKYPDALAKILLPQLSGFIKTVGKRSVATALYRKAFPFSSPSVPSRFPVMVKDREHTLNDVASAGIYLGSWYTQPVAPKELNLKKVGYNKGSCPTAESVCRNIINLPTLIMPGEAERIIRMLKNYL